MATTDTQWWAYPLLIIIFTLVPIGFYVMAKRFKALEDEEKLKAKRKV